MHNYLRGVTPYLDTDYFYHWLHTGDKIFSPNDYTVATQKPKWITPPTQCTVKPTIKDTPKEDKPPNKRQAKSTLVYTLYRKSPLKEDNLSTKDTRSVLIKRFHYSCLQYNSLPSCDHPIIKFTEYHVTCHM